jgi:transposase
MAQEKVFVGIDVSKLWLDVMIRPTGETLRVTNDRDGWLELIRGLRGMAVEAIGLEASGGYERGLMRALLDARLPARQLNPLRVRQFAKGCGILAKNDRIDAGVIARFVEVVPQRQAERNKEAEVLAELVTARRQLCEELTRATNQAGHATHPLVRRLARQRANRLKIDKLILEKAMAQAVAENADMAHKESLMRSVPGVGPVFAQTLLALMPELGNLSNRQAASLLGVAPFDCESGNFKGQRRIFGGRRQLRDVAYMAAVVAGTHNPVFSNFKKRLRDAGKRPKVAIVAVMRKLIVTLNAMLRNNQPWAYA